MREFINALFKEENRIDFQYMDYCMSFYSGQFQTYYLMFYIDSQDELINLWDSTGDIFSAMKENSDMYNTDMDKNIMCIYCLQTTDEEYYETGKTGTISELSKKICLVEEDLNFFSKHVFLYTDRMNQFSSQHVGKFDDLCRKYLTRNNFEQYKYDIKKHYVYDFLVNLFIKLPFLKIEEYYASDQVESQYRSVISFVQERFDDSGIDSYKIEEDMECIKQHLDSDDAFFKWLDEQIESDEKIQKEENE